MPPKMSSPYILYRNPLESTIISALYDAKNKLTNQIWHAKVIDNSAVQKYFLKDYVDYNEVVLSKLKQKENVIYINEIFEKSGKTFIIQQKFKQRLSTYLQSKILSPQEVTTIIQNVFCGLCDVYSQGYVHRSIRPQHIVQVDDLWKIQTLVLDTEQYGQCPWVWSERYASPQQRRNRQEIADDEQRLDRQIVWQMGILAITLLMGKNIGQSKPTRDADLPWNQIKNKLLNHPDLFQMVDKCCRCVQSQRISLKGFLKLKIFEELDREQEMRKNILTASKIFKVTTFGVSSMQKSMKIKNEKSSSNQAKKAQENKKIDEQLRQEFEICKFFAFITNLTSSKFPKNDNATCLQYFYLKKSEKLFSQFKFKFESKANEQYRYSSAGRLLQKDAKRLQNQLNSIPIRAEQLKKERLSALHPKINKLDVVTPELPQQLLRKYINILSGSIYKELIAQYSSNPNIQFEKNICYIVYAACLNNFTQAEHLRQYQQVSPKGQKIIAFTKIFQECESIDKLVTHSQTLFKKYFQTVQ